MSSALSRLLPTRSGADTVEGPKLMVTLTELPISTSLAAEVGNLRPRGWLKLSTHPRKQLLGVSIARFQPLYFFKALEGLLPLFSLHVALPSVVEGAYFVLSLLGFVSRLQEPFGVWVGGSLQVYLLEDVDHRLPLLTLM